MSRINRIILVGNGFDLAHNLKTKYQDFIDWYHDKLLQCLQGCDEKYYSDGLYSFSFCDASLENKIGFSNVLSHLKKWSELHDFMNNNAGLYTYKASDFMNDICTAYITKGWVDIESEYYSELLDKYQDRPKDLNEELKTLTNYLVEYLNYIQNGRNKTQVLGSLFSKIFAPIHSEEVSVKSQKAFYDFVEYRLKNEFEVPLYEYDLLGKIVYGERTDEDREALKSFHNKWKGEIEYCGILKCANHYAEFLDDIPDFVLYPDRVMLLNFNYTNIADLYYKNVKYENEYYLPIIHIHGSLSDPSGIIFGYGDELDDNYKKIVNLNNNECLRNIKSIKYLESDKYRQILKFLESAPFQVYIMGHSCGNSDRTLLNTLFEHPNCISIKPFYYCQNQLTDNYLDIVQNISRNFTDMKLMRDLVVNKKYCSPIITN